MGTRKAQLLRPAILMVAASLAFLLTFAGPRQTVFAPAPSPLLYVLGRAGSDVMPIDSATNTAGTPISVGSNPLAVAITPDGSTAYVADFDDNAVTPIDTATGTAGPAIPVGNGPDGIAISPDGATAYITNHGSGTVTPIDTATNTPGTPINVGSGVSAIAITPDGSTAYVVNPNDSTVTPLDLATKTPGVPIALSATTPSIAITPDGATAYVTSQSGVVIPIDLSTNTVGLSIPVGTSPSGIAITPDGSTLYVSDGSGYAIPVDVATNTPGTAIAIGALAIAVAISPDGATAYVVDEIGSSVTPIATATGTAGTSIPVTAFPQGLAVQPDQAPVAALSVTPALPGQPSSFDASASTVAFGSIVGFAWDFGDGHTATTGTATTTHTYAAPGPYTATVTETDSAGTSTQQVFTGQTVSRNGGPSAVASLGFTVVPPIPAVLSAPKIERGTSPLVDEKLGLYQGAWSSSPTSYAFQWIRCDADGTSNCGDRAGKTSSNYRTVAGDAGHTLKVRVVAHNLGGDSAAATSAPSGVVTLGVPLDIALPTIEHASTPAVGVKLGAGVGKWSGMPSTYTFQWVRCDGDGTTNCGDLAGRTGSVYRPVAGDAGHTFRIRVVAHNTAGASAPATSGASGIVS